MATAKKTTKKAPAKRATRATSTRTTGTTKTAATGTPASNGSTATGTTAEKGLRIGGLDLSDFDVRSALTDSAYATVGAGDRAVEVARTLPERVETFVRTAVKEAPEKLRTELDDTVAEARKEFRAYATRGRKVWDEVAKAEPTRKALDRTEVARTQVAQTVTSLRGYVEQGQDAVEKAAERVGLRRSA